MSETGTPEHALTSLTSDDFARNVQIFTFRTKFMSTYPLVLDRPFDTWKLALTDFEAE
jgi:hypothetical protein